MNKNKPASPTLDPRLLELLACPVTHGALVYDAKRQELISKSAKLAYPIRDGIPVMLEDEARKLDITDLIPSPSLKGRAREGMCS